MGCETAKCIAVVDGGMIILEDGRTVTLAGVRVPRVGLPGGAAMRTVLQRMVQDAEVVFEVVGNDSQGYPVVAAAVGGVDLEKLMNDAMSDYGYSV